MARAAIWLDEKTSVRANIAIEKARQGDATMCEDSDAIESVSEIA